MLVYPWREIELALTAQHSYTNPYTDVEVWAEVPGARSLAVAEDGAKVFVGTRGSAVYAVLDPERDGVANQVITVADGLLVPNGLALDEDGGLFVVEQDRITRREASGEIDTMTRMSP